jgi:hypothetical protein
MLTLSITIKTCDNKHNNTQHNGSAVMLSVIYSECRKQALYAECRKQVLYGECRYAECRYAECRGAIFQQCK